MRSDFNPLIESVNPKIAPTPTDTRPESCKTESRPDSIQADPIPKKKASDLITLGRHKMSSFNPLVLNDGLQKATSEKTLEDIEEGRVTPITQMSLMDEPVTEKLPFAHEEMVVPSVKLPLPSDFVVEASLDTEGPQFNLPKIEKLQAPTPVEPWAVTTDVVPYEDRPSTSGASSSSGPHDASGAVPNSDDQADETKQPPRPMSRNASRWAPTFVTHQKSNLSLHSLGDSDDEDGDKTSRTNRPKSQYRVREAKPEEAQYDGPYSSYPDSHTPML